MIREEKCILCGSNHLARVPATIAPFIKVRCNIEGPFEDFFRLYCPSCDFSFYNERLSVEEILRLYNGYRDPVYHKLRMELEPDWTDLRDSFSDRSDRNHLARIMGLSSLLKEWGISPSNVLDYGGGRDAWLSRGAFPDAEVQTYDISFESPRPASGAFDLVVCSHVLEHASYPLQMVGEMYEYMAPGGYLYIEVPYNGSHLASTLIDGHPLNRMHEHVSHFSPASLARLVEAAGLTPIRARVWRTPGRVSAIIGSRTPGGNAPPPLIVEQHDAMDTPDLPRGMHRIHQRAEQWAREQVRIVIHPAGAYAMELLAYTALRDAAVVALSDKNTALHTRTLMGKKVVPPSSIPELNPELVLIASPRYESEISAEMAWLRDLGIEVVRGAKI